MKEPTAHWSFVSTSADFDGARILQEARDAGGCALTITRDYEVQHWIHTSLHKRAYACGLPVNCSAPCVPAVLGGRLDTVWGSYATAEGSGWYRLYAVQETGRQTGTYTAYELLQLVQKKEQERLRTAVQVWE